MADQHSKILDARSPSLSNFHFCNTVDFVKSTPLFPSKIRELASLPPGHSMEKQHVGRANILWISIFDLFMLYFHAVFGKIWPNNSLAPPGEILDSPMFSIENLHHDSRLSDLLRLLLKT